MQSYNLEQSPRKFLHKCRDCGNQYRVSIRVEMRTIHRATCPHCSRTYFFDNRDGQLERRGQEAGRSSDTARPESPSARSDGDFSLNNVGTPAPEIRREVPTYEGPSGEGPLSPLPPRKKERKPLFQRKTVEVPTKTEKGPRTPRKMPRVALRRPRRGLLDFLPIDHVREHWRRYAVLAIVGGVLLPLLIILSFRFPSLYLQQSPETYLKRLRGVTANRITDRRGELISELFRSKTGTLREQDIPVSLKKKLTFVEDRNFYSHGGVHWPSITRAFFINLISGGYSQGGSTLTQQLARILLRDRTRSIFRKFRETALAYYLEANLSKDQIMTGYMNHVYLGHGASGMETAGEFYFNKKLNELNFVEELILVSLPSAPNRYSPLENPRVLEKKLDVVFNNMREDGFTNMTPAAFTEMKMNAFRALNRSPGESIFGSRVNQAPYVAEHVRLFIRRVLGDDFQYDAGLVIETTVDGRLQAAVDKASSAHIKALSNYVVPATVKRGKRVYNTDVREAIAREYQSMGLGAVLVGLPQARNVRPRLQTASIGVIPATGEVLFMQGGTEFKPGNQLNRAVQMRRQTGSAIKPIIYSAGIESGILTPATMVDDSPIVAKKQKRFAGDRDTWVPENYDGTYEGLIPVRRALAMSKNTATIHAGDRIGLERMSEQFRKFFFVSDHDFNTRFRYNQSIFIGTLEMSPLEMAVAYSAFANNGKIQRPYLVRRVLDADGKVLYTYQGKDEFATRRPETQKVYPGDATQVMVSLMRDSGKNGGVYRGGFPGGDFIGKTGTTNEFRDAWFVGATPGLSVAVWIGYDEPTYSMWRATGSSAAGPLWGRIMALRGRDPGSFQFSPSAVQTVVCPQSGLLPLPQCPRRTTETFTQNGVPKETCDIHRDGARRADTPTNNNNDPDPRSTDFE